MELKRKILGKHAKTEPVKEKEAQLGSNNKDSELGDLQELKKSMSADSGMVPQDEAAEAGAENTDPENAIPGRKLSLFRTVLLLSTASCLLAAVAGFVFVRSKSHPVVFANGSQELEPVTSIMRPIPQPNYLETLDFLLAYDVGGQKMVTAMRMEIGFQSPTRYQNFKEQTVAFRDVVYVFLLRQNLYGNSTKTWRSVVEKDLLDCLMVRLPQSYPDKILLTQVEYL